MEFQNVVTNMENVESGMGCNHASDIASNVDIPEIRERTEDRNQLPLHGKHHLPPVEPPSATSSPAKTVGKSAQCPICLQKFCEQEVGSPNVCDHSYCFKCILEWSKTATTCPIDRQSFRMIVVRNQFGGNVVREVGVMEKLIPDDIAFAEGICQICGTRDNEESILFCAGCNLSYHLECISPTLPSVPLGSWLCPLCSFDNALLQSNIFTAEQIFDEHDIEFMLNQPSTSRQCFSGVGEPITFRRKRNSRLKITYKTAKNSSQRIRLKAKRTKQKVMRAVRRMNKITRRLEKRLGISAASRNMQLLSDMGFISSNDSISSIPERQPEKRLPPYAGIPAFHLFEFFPTPDDDDTNILYQRRPTAASATAPPVFKRNRETDEDENNGEDKTDVDRNRKKEENVSSTTNVLLNHQSRHSEDNDVVEEECQNFSLHSKHTLGFVEKRSHSPCLDERTLPPIVPLASRDTETISDAFEINAKESELDMRPKDCEESETVDEHKKLERNIQIKQTLTEAATETVAIPAVESVAPAMPVEAFSSFKRINKCTKKVSAKTAP